MTNYLDAYAAYLDSIGRTYHTRNGFSVYFALANTDCAWIEVRERDGGMWIWDYFGMCYSGVRAANRLCKEYQSRYSQYHVWTEKYTGIEIGVEEKFPFISPEDVHQHVTALAAAVDDGIPIGKEMLGDCFER